MAPAPHESHPSYPYSSSRAEIEVDPFEKRRLGIFLQGYVVQRLISSGLEQGIVNDELINFYGSLVRVEQTVRCLENTLFNSTFWISE